MQTLSQELLDYMNGICCPAPVVTFNFDVDSSDWAGAGITDQASFDSVLGVTTDQFLLSGNNIKANILTTNSNTINLKVKQITNIGYITVSGLIEINLEGNQIVTFNPTIALPSSLQNLYLNSNQIVTFNPTIALPSSLQNLYLNSNQIVTFNPTIALPSSLVLLELSANQIITFNPTIALPSSLQNLYLESNQIVNFNPTIALPSNLQFLYLSGNQIIEFNPTIALPSSLVFLGLNDNQMTISGYTASEPWANGMHTAPSGGEINLQFNTDSASGTNLETILVSKGWTVNV
jgi:Leucine-rich repeat (LRR) protein